MYIKKFESLSVDDNVDSCKDMLETINDFDDDIKIQNYSVGYIYSDRVNKTPSTERDKRGIKFTLCLKKDFEKIDNKESFDDQIFLTQKAKYLYTKVRSYCDDIKVEFRSGLVNFTLQFENTDDSIKRKAKIDRIYKGINNALKDYDRFKTIYFSSEVQMKDLPNELELLRLINNTLGQNLSFFHFRFSVDISEENGIISLKPKEFRYKDNNGKWKNVRYNNNTAKVVVKCLHDNLSSRYIYNVNQSDVKYEEKDTVLNIIVL